MMKNKQNNYAFIDGQNLYLGVNKLRWHLDYIRFRKYLTEKYYVSKAYMFMGFIPENQELYNFLQTSGYILIFKPVFELKDGTIKGNCDAELVLQAMIDYQEYNKAVIITGDGDFYCLVKHLDDKNKLAKVLAPSPTNCSSLLKKIAKDKLAYVQDLKPRVQYKKSTS